MWNFLHLLAQTICKSATLEDARGCGYADGQECLFTSSVGPFRPGSPPSYPTGAARLSLGGQGDLCLGGTPGQRWWNPAERDGSSGIPSPAGEQKAIW